MNWGMRCAALLIVPFSMSVSTGVSALSLREAVQHTVHTNPSVASAQADRRATGFELRQAQGRLLPQIDLSADVGYQKIDRPNGLGADVNDRWFAREQGTINVRQVLFDGWDRANDIYKNAARLDASAWRLLERSQALGLNAVETYIDVRRYTRLVEIAVDNVRRHKAILRIVVERRDGGKSSDGEVNQAEQRVAATEAAVAEIKQALLESRARFLQVIGRKPGRTQVVRFPKRLPRTKSGAVKIAITDNPTIRAAEADIDVARYERDQNDSAYFPQVSLEGTGVFGNDVNATPGKSEDLFGRVVVSWNIFDGLITTNRRRALTARWGQAQRERDARVREVRESVERAWASYIQGGERVKSFRKQEKLNRDLVKSYLEEYQLSKRTLLDLLDSENALFQSRIQLSSVYAVHLFSSYQLLASMGDLLERLGVTPPAEVVADHRVQSQKSFGIFKIDIEPLRKQ